MTKNIAVFADGTNNSSAALFRTNVWRLYQALDTQVSADRVPQLAYYHDGVGTSSFRPLAILGGAFGWGVKRNVLDCYKFVCRNYQPGDRIYLFGFSRGAFTVRVLASLICHEGLVKPDSNRNLEIYARDAYRAYRRRFNWTGGLVGPLRSARDRYLAWMRRRSNRSIYTPKKNVKPQKHGNGFAVEFIGAWDTVAAYGTPVAELTRGIDEWIWPLSMPDYTLHDGVRIARHAVALDDERDTFHPLLWDEIRSKSPERIHQVWFAGVHSDVGGGYPDDSASYKPLQWMMDQAAAAGLTFVPHAVNEIRRTAMSTGPLHDSRRGLAGYYRYQPRKIGAHINPPDPTTRLMQDPKQPAARLQTVNIHESVLERIATANDGYAPIVLTGNYAIVADDGTARPVSQLQRESDQERVWDWVWHKRVCYFASLFVSLCLALFPVWHWVSHPAPCTGPACLLAPVISSAGAVLPGFAAPWISAFAETPGWTVVFVAVLAWLLWRSGILQDRIRSEMRASWERTLRLPAVTTPPPAWLPLRIHRLRTSPSYQNFFQRLKWKWLPPAFGAPLLILLIVGGLTGVGIAAVRGGIWVAEATGECPSADAYKTTSKCYPLGRSVEVDRLYRITVQVTAPWSDRRISTSPEGFGPTRMSFIGNLMAPLRRSPSARWFQPLIKIVGSNLGPIRFYRIVPLEMQ
jgi:uncharacterized protein (DUF2235 family)